MFSRLYRAISIAAPLRNKRPVESTKISAKCTSSNHAPIQPQIKPSSRNSLKCSAGVLFLQRQFMRSFCLLQPKDVAQQNGHESAALRTKQQQHVESPVLSLINENLASSSVGASKETSLFQTHESNSPFPVLSKHLQPSYPNVPSRVFRCANIKATSDNHPYNADTSLRRLYSTSTDPKKSEELPEKGPLQDIKKQNILTVPNFLTMSRICLTPLLGYLVVQESFSLACGLFVFAGLTDMVDGYIARRFPSQTSAFGSFLDPLADKILISVVFVSLTFVKLIPLSLAILVIGRDIGLIVAAFYVRYISLNPPITFKSFFDATHGSAQLQPLMISKINTMLQLGLVTVSLAAPVFGYVDHVFLHYLWYLTAFTTTVSGIGYVFAKDTFKILQQKRKTTK